MPPQSSRTLTEQEFTAIEDRLIAEAPSGLDPENFERWIGPRLAAAVAEAEYGSQEPEGSAGGRFASNLGAMLNPVEMAKGVYQAVTSPIDTAKGIVGASAEQGRKALGRAREGRYVEALAHAGGMIPVLGPVAANIGEQIAGGVSLADSAPRLGFLHPRR